MRISKKPVSSLSLTSRGPLDLTFLGVGSAFSKTLNQTNLMIVKDDHHLLVDCGTRCAYALYHDYGLPLTSIKTFLITHSHADHIGGLEEAQLSARYVTKQRPTMIITRSYEKILWEQSLRGGAEASESVPLTFSDLWNVIRPTKLNGFSRDTYQTCVGNIDIKLFRTKHFPDSATSWRTSAWSCGILIDDRVLFTSDTRFDPEMIHDFNNRFNPEIIFHDCQLFTGGVHTGIEELATLPPEIKSKVILVHYGDHWENFKPYARQSGFHSWAKQGHRYRFED